MKRFKKLLPVLLIIMLLLSACGEKTPKEFKLSDRYKTVGLENVYDLAMEDILKEKTVSQCSLNGDYLLLATIPKDSDYYYENTELILYSLSKGEVLSECEVSSYINATFPAEDKIALINDTGVQVYDLSFNLLCEYKAEGMFAGYCNNILALFNSDNKLSIVSQLDCEEKKLEVPEGYFPFDALKISGEKVYFILRDEDYKYYVAYADTENGTIEVIDSGNDYQSWFEGRLTVYGADNWYIAEPETPDVLKVLSRENEENSMWNIGDKLLIISHYESELSDDGTYIDRTTYTACDWNRNTVSQIAGTSIEGCTALYAQCVDDSYRVILSADVGEEQKILLWDLSSYEVNAAAPETIAVNDIPQLIAEKVQEIRNRHGVDIIYKEDGISQYDSGYKLTVAKEDVNLYEAVCAFDKYLAEYPEKMIKALVSKEGNPMQFYIGEDFIRNNEFSISSPAAVTSNMWDYITIGFDISYMSSLRQNLAHELSHVFDDFICDCGYEKNLDYIRYWEDNLNSPDYPYFYTYVDADGVDINMSTLLTLDGESSKWFIDSYARSYPTEDRARIFEHLFMGNKFYFESEELQRKAKFLCGAIRETFDLADADTEYPWEKLFGTVNDLSEFTDICQVEAMG